MFAELKKSLFSTIEDRISSPFYGSLAFSWVLWNWRAIYATFFVSQEYMKPFTKVTYISAMYRDHWYTIPLLIFLGPIASAFFLILAMPKLTNWLFKKDLEFEKIRIVLREEQTKSQRLTHEQSLSVRSEMNQLRENHIKQLESKTTEVAAWKGQTEQLQNEKNSFKILYAEYGTETKFSDVTQIIQNILLANEKLLINNTILQTDPAHDEYKRLLIVYSVKGNVHTITAKELEVIEFEGKTDLLTSTETEESKNTYAHVIDTKVLSSLEKLFPGTWHLKYEGTIEGEEDVKIREMNKYFYKIHPSDTFVHAFDLIHIQVNLTTNRILFYKKDVENKNRIVLSELNIIEMGKEYIGIEDNGNIRVTYTRIE